MSFHGSVCFTLCFLTTLFVCCVQFSSAGNNDTDKLALYEIKSRITHDPLGIFTSWNESLPFCEWNGVTCGHKHQRVIALELHSSKLTGTLSPFVGNLSFLRALNLKNNSFTGSIPPEIGRLHRLQKLNLLNNSFGGGIPSNLSRCSSLIFLKLDNNMLVGEIPPALGSLLNLQFLGLQLNKLTGPIPSSLGNLTSLLEIYMAESNLIGTIPESLGRLKQLRVLYLGENNFSGRVPPSIFNLSLLVGFDLGANNNLSGSLPLHLGTMLPNLQFFSIAINHFTGSIPASISNCSHLVTLQLNTNYLRGEVPCLHKLQSLKRILLYGNHLGLGQSTDLDYVSCLANATMLDTLDIGDNNFGGIFPSIICNFTTLSWLALGPNNIAGPIPSCIHNLAQIQALSVRGNKISGGIPPSIGRLKSLVMLDLSANQLSGRIPSTIGNLTHIDQLYLGGNKLEGNIPSTLGNYRYIRLLDISINNLRGKIPLQLFNLSSLSVGLGLFHNSLTGSLPREVGNFKNLVALDASYTMLSGVIPSTLGACITLQFLYLQGNHFLGAIPPTLNALRGLNQLDLSRNNFSGEIPEFLSDFPSLQLLNLSYNDFEGEVPIGGVFSNKTGLSIVGNSRLCGGIPELMLPPCNFKKSRKGRLGHTRRLLISIFSVILGVGLLTTCILLYAFKKRRNQPKVESEGTFPSLSYQDILKATNGLSSENLIGSGTFGVVYKAILDLGERTNVAIKVFNLAHRAACRSFMAECQVLRNTRHRNLVKVVTACSSVDYQGNDFKALVYEYMVNGSLEDWLHQMPISREEGTNEAPRKLNLLQRFDIASDVASALEYLHHHCDVPIVHCDLKPSNVLLDGDMVAHVGDFGLAKFLSNAIAISHQSSSIGVRGTVGYTPPEYGIGNELSTLGDVYSFGILVLEIFTRKRPTDEMFKEGTSLRSFVQTAWPERVMEIIDHVLLEDIFGEEMNGITDPTNYLLRTGESKAILETVTEALGIALSCCAEVPQDRLDMGEVAAKLNAFRNNLSRFRYLRQG